MVTPIIVPDASVILKWAFRSLDEPNRDQAMGLLSSWLSGKVEIVLPKLWVFEVGNVLGLKTPQYAQEIMEVLIGYHFEEYEMTAEISKRTFQLMKQYLVTFYDAVYHAVALTKKGMLVTTDKVYYRKSVKAGSVILLEDFSP